MHDKGLRCDAWGVSWLFYELWLLNGQWLVLPALKGPGTRRVPLCGTFWEATPPPL